MLLTLRVTGPHASDLEVLLDKCPDKLHSTRLSFGSALVFFPEVSPNAVTVALALDVDAVGLSPNLSSPPFVEPNSAMLSVAIASVFRTALDARLPNRPSLVTSKLPIEVRIASFSAARGTDELRALFGPLGYGVVVEEAGVATTSATAGNIVRLEKQCPLYEVLSHLYVLGPVVDGRADDPVLDDQRDALLMHAEGVVRGHPAGDRILQAYTVRRPSETAAAFARLQTTDPLAGQTFPEATSLLDETRMDAIVLELREVSAHSVIDLGCGDGKLLGRLVREKALTRIVGFDVSHRLLDGAASRMKLDRRGGKKSERIELVHGSLFYADSRMQGFDAAVLADVVQHVPQDRLADLEKSVFEKARPTTVVALVSGGRRGEVGEGDPEPQMVNLANGWSTNQFDAWAMGISERRGYRVRLLSPGSSAQLTRMAVFSR
jgi:3' terminal RNA ribose 2'-O-methyltransferase Hen1